MYISAKGTTINQEWLEKHEIEMIEQVWDEFRMHEPWGEYETLSEVWPDIGSHLHEEWERNYSYEVIDKNIIPYAKKRLQEEFYTFKEHCEQKYAIAWNILAPIISTRNNRTKWKKRLYPTSTATWESITSEDIRKLQKEEKIPGTTPRYYHISDESVEIMIKIKDKLQKEEKSWSQITYRIPTILRELKEEEEEWELKVTEENEEEIQSLLFSTVYNIAENIADSYCEFLGLQPHWAENASGLPKGKKVWWTESLKFYDLTTYILYKRLAAQYYWEEQRAGEDTSLYERLTRKKNQHYLYKYDSKTIGESSADGEKEDEHYLGKGY